MNNNNLYKLKKKKNKYTFCPPQKKYNWKGHPRIFIIFKKDIEICKYCGKKFNNE